MNLIVRKYGGSSLENFDQIKNIAESISDLYKNGHKVIVVVSAMGKSTDNLTKMAYEMSSKPIKRELDMLLTAGERISMSLMSIALNDLGVPAISFTGSQAGIMTDGSHSNASIKEIKPIRIQAALNENKVVVLAGFQGVDPKTKEVTTLGRGGSDTTAVAMAAHFEAKRCEILKDVDGFYSADPKMVEGTIKYDKVNINSLLEATYWGARVVHHKAVELALKHNVSLYIGSSLAPKNGTEIFQSDSITKAFFTLNSYSLVLKVKSIDSNIESVHNTFNEHSLNSLQVLGGSHSSGYWITGDKNELQIFKQLNLDDYQLTLGKTDYCSISITVSSRESLERIENQIDQLRLPKKDCVKTSQSMTFFINAQDFNGILMESHKLIKNSIQ